MRGLHSVYVLGHAPVRAGPRATTRAPVLDFDELDPGVRVGLSRTGMALPGNIAASWAGTVARWLRAGRCGRREQAEGPGGVFGAQPAASGRGLGQQPCGQASEGQGSPRRKYSASSTLPSKLVS